MGAADQRPVNPNRPTGGAGVKARRSLSRWSGCERQRAVETYLTGWWLVMEIRLKAFIVIATHATAA